MVPQMLTRAQLQNGVILGNIAFMALLQFGGPFLGGILTEAWGLTLAFSVEVVLLAVGAALFSRVNTDRPPVTERRSIRRDLAAGLRYVWQDKSLVGLLTVGAIPGIFIMGPFSVTVVILVEDVFKASDGYVGAIWGSFGGGILLGSVLLTLRRFRRRGPAVAACIIMGGAIFTGYGLNESLPVALVLLVVLGVVGPAIFINVVVALVQERTRPDMMGRVMSMYGLTFSATAPLGALMAGALASATGPQTTIIVGGVCTVAAGIGAVFLRPVWRLD
jgi:predicted MFS family arabinose efflux permease